MRRALDRIIAEGLTLNQTESYIEELLTPPEEPKPDEHFKMPVRKAAIGDVRLFSNSLTKLVSTLRNAGIDADSKKRGENDKYIEFKVRISKNCAETSRCTQLKIC